MESALARERQLKRWTTAKKEALITGGLAVLKSLTHEQSAADREHALYE